jgi:hypothetical protein
LFKPFISIGSLDGDKNHTKILVPIRRSETKIIITNNKKLNLAIILLLSKKSCDTLIRESNEDVFLFIGFEGRYESSFELLTIIYIILKDNIYYFFKMLKNIIYI